MIDPADHLTGNLPTIEPLLAPVVRLTAAQRREVQGYQEPKERHSCRNCLYADQRFTRPDSPTETMTLWCTTGNFPVKLGSFCAAWVKVFK